MDKQKQIEEMRGVIKHYAINQHCNKGNTYKSHLITSDSKGIAIALYNAGYRKIPENAVVLTREELQAHDKALLEKLAERVKMAFYYHFDELIPSIMADKIDEICKEIIGG